MRAAPGLAIKTHSLPQLCKSPRHWKPDAALGAGKDHLRMTRVSHSISGNIRELLVRAKVQALLHQRWSTGSPVLLF